LKDPMST